MSCPFDKEKLTGYFDGELAPSERSEVESHISSCSECLRDLGEIKAAALLVRDLPRRRAPRSIAEGVSREIAAAGRAARFRRLRGGLLWATAAAAAVLIVVNVAYFAGMDSRSAPEADSAKAPVRSIAPGLGLKTLEDNYDAREKSIGKADDPGRTGLYRQEAMPAEGAEAKDLDRAVRRAADKGAANAIETEKARDSLAKSEPERPEAPPPPAEPAPREEARKATAAPGAPPAAAPAPVAPPPTAKKPDAAAPQKEEKPGDAPALDELAESKAKKEAGGPLVGGRGKAGEQTKFVHLTLAAADPAQARSRAAEVLKKLGVRPEASPVEKLMRARKGPLPSPLVVDLTEKQIEEFRKEMGKDKALLLVDGRAEEAGKRFLENGARELKAGPRPAGAGGGAVPFGAAEAEKKQEADGKLAAAQRGDTAPKDPQPGAAEDQKSRDEEDVRQLARQQGPAVFRVVLEFLVAPPADAVELRK